MQYMGIERNDSLERHLNEIPFDSAENNLVVW